MRLQRRSSHRLPRPPMATADHHSLRPRDLAAAVGGGIVALVAVHLILRGTYWDYSEGVYALTAHLWLHGHALYRDVVGAQPPGVFVVGAALLALKDALEFLRAGVAGLQLVGGLAASIIVWRLTANRVGAILAAPAVLLTPWAIHEHGALTPELIAVPLLLWAALFSVSTRRAAVTGLLCGLLPLVKVPYILPAIVLLACSADRRRSIRWAAATLAAGVLATALLAGEAAWRDVIYAQTQSGYRPLHVIVGYWAQSGWNLAGLLIAAGLIWRHRALIADRRLLRTTFALAVAMLLTFVANAKQGTALNVTVPVEAALMPLAVCGAVLVARQGARNWEALLCAAALLFAAVQSASLLIAPSDPAPFVRVASRFGGLGESMSPSQLRASVARARSCAPRLSFSGPPFIAWVAARHMPANEPDQFIISHAPILAAKRAAVDAADRRGICP